MGIEIERKYLVVDDSWREHARGAVSYRQGYLTKGESSSVRVRIGDDRAYLNIKSATLGVSRAEFEYDIPTADAEQILEQLCRRPLIVKTRYRLTHGSHEWEVDVFGGENEGLVVAEVELADPAEDFEAPPWIGAEVSDDPRYYNACLVDHPFREW